MYTVWSLAEVCHQMVTRGCLPERTTWSLLKRYQDCFAADSFTISASSLRTLNCRNPHERRTGSSTVNRPSMALVQSSIISPATFIVSLSPTAESYRPTTARLSFDIRIPRRCSDKNHDCQRPGVHPAFSTACAASRCSQSPLLWTMESHTSKEHL